MAKCIEQHNIAFSSNGIRLSWREWILTGIIVAIVLCFGPVGWERIERFSPGTDYRIPYRLGNDYWMYNRYCRRIGEQDKTLVLGDSVIWGHYVAKEQTLSHYLNELAVEERFVNIGIDGIHPAAMAGLIEHYGKAISNKKVIVAFNPLWISSKRHDLQTEKEFSFNHPRLVRQFFENIPCYDATYADRIGVVIERYLPFYDFTRHLRAGYFDNTNITGWTMKNPYKNPLASITLQLPSSNEKPSPEPISKPWTEKGISQFNASWVNLETSIQWRNFKRTLRILKNRGNKIFVLVGPFNEHMLSKEALQEYTEIKGKIELWLKENNFPYYTPTVLSSELYADASHPLAKGYAMLAKKLFENDYFVCFDNRGAQSESVLAAISVREKIELGDWYDWIRKLMTNRELLSLANSADMVVEATRSKKPAGSDGSVIFNVKNRLDCRNNQEDVNEILVYNFDEEQVKRLFSKYMLPRIFSPKDDYLLFLNKSKGGYMPVEKLRGGFRLYKGQGAERKNYAGKLGNTDVVIRYKSLMPLIKGIYGPVKISAKPQRKSYKASDRIKIDLSIENTDPDEAFWVMEELQLCAVYLWAEVELPQGDFVLPSKRDYFIPEMPKMKILKPGEVRKGTIELELKGPPENGEEIWVRLFQKKDILKTLKKGTYNIRLKYYLERTDMIIMSEPIKLEIL